MGGFPPLRLDSLTFSGPACPADSTGSATVVPTGGQAPYTYAWATGASSAALSGLPAGTYPLTVTDARGCLASATIALPAAPGLAQWGIVLSDTLLCAGSALTLTAALPPVADFYWTLGTTTVSDSATLTLTQAGTVGLHVVTLAGCLLHDELELRFRAGDSAADFLLPTEAVVHDPVVAIDITWPVPLAIEWLFDPAAATAIATLPTQQVLAFPAPGTFTIGLRADLGGCFSYLQKDIRIYGSRDSLAQQQLPAPPTPEITSFELFPNPNLGDFQLRLFLRAVQPADVWIFAPNADLITYQALAGSNYYAIPFRGPPLAAGTYTAIARAGETWRYLNFVVL